MTLEELTKPLTAAQVEAAIYSAIVAKGLKTTSWKPGAVVRTIIAALAIVLAGVTVLVSLVARGGFLDLATGPWLDLVAYYVYDTSRIQETFATGTVKLTNSSGVGSFSFVQPGDLVVKRADGKTYRSTEAFSLPAVLGATVEVTVQADEAGSASTAAPGAIDEFVTIFVGCDVVNEVALVGADRETDTSLRARARAKTGVLSPNGPRDAYHYVATSATRADGTSIGVTRVLTVADGAGGVNVYVADGDGPLGGSAGDPATDLGAVADAIHRWVEPLAVTPTVQNGTPVAQDVTYELWVRDTSGLTDDEIKALVSANLLAFFSEQPIGGVVLPSSTGKLYLDAIRLAIGSALPPGIFLELNVSEPAADVAITVPEFATAGLITGVIHQVPGN